VLEAAEKEMQQRGHGFGCPRPSPSAVRASCARYASADRPRRPYRRSWAHRSSTGRAGTGWSWSSATKGAPEQSASAWSSAGRAPHSASACPVQRTSAAGRRRGRTAPMREEQQHVGRSCPVTPLPSFTAAAPMTLVPPWPRDSRARLPARRLWAAHSHRARLLPRVRAPLPALARRARRAGARRPRRHRPGSARSADDEPELARALDLLHELFTREPFA
jgi:hypothetical protein